MNQLVDNILERSTAQKVAILGATIILLAALYYSFLYSPGADEVAKLADSVEIARNEKAVKTQKAANLVRLRKDLQQLDAELKLAISQLPEKREIPDLLSSISAKAQQSGLDVLLFRPRVETFQDFYAEIPVDITVKGNFQNTVSFFDEVGHLSRLVNIDNIGFKNPTANGEQVLLETTSVATAFRFLDEAERKKVAEEKAKAAKTKKYAHDEFTRYPKSSLVDMLRRPYDRKYARSRADPDPVGKNEGSGRQAQQSAGDDRSVVAGIKRCGSGEAKTNFRRRR